MAKSVNLNKLKDEIDSRKKERNTFSSTTGEVVTYDGSPRDVFLNGLYESIKTGRETPATSLIKTVENKVAAKKGETPKFAVNEAPVQQQRQPIDMSPERDEQLFHDLEVKRKLTLAESIEQYKTTPHVGAPMQPMQQTSQTAPMQINEVYLSENVKKIVNNYLSENFGVVVEEAIKSTILEMYAVERIKEVLHENKDLIKTVVVEVIRELQARNKAKAQ